MQTFETLGLHATLLQAITDAGYDRPTPIQAAAIPLLLAGHDVLGQAQTGTGKTAAFALPLLQRLAVDRPADDQTAISALIVTPTRELALQVARAVHGYGSALDVRVLTVYGGQPYGRQISRLRKGVDVVVGTPGRLLDLLDRQALDLSAVQSVVLDEADEMLSMGFIDDIARLLEATPPTRQTALFSATLPEAIRALARQYLRDPQTVTVANAGAPVARIDQRYYFVQPADKMAALVRLLEAEQVQRALVFAETRIDSAQVAADLGSRNFAAEAINGDLSQDAREQVLARFRSGQIELLVATDVAARGLDIDDVTHVINYELPRDPARYVHRIGRTGRAGKDGVALSLVTPRELGRLRTIERMTRHTITHAAVPTPEAIVALRSERLVEQMRVWLRRGRCQSEKALAQALADEGFDMLEVAAAALKLAQAQEKQRPIEPVEALTPESGPARRARKSATPTDRPRTRREQPVAEPRTRREPVAEPRTRRPVAEQSHEAGMVRLMLDVGRADGLRPNDVVGAVAYHAEIPGRAIGAIHIRPTDTLFDVPERFVTQVLGASGTLKIGRRSVVVQPAV